MVLSKTGMQDGRMGLSQDGVKSKTRLAGRMVLSKAGWVAGWHEVESAERVGRDQGQSTLTRPQIMMLMIHRDDDDYDNDYDHGDDDS